MSGIKKSGAIKQDRRRFLGAAAMTVASSRLGMFAVADAQASEAEPGGSLAAKSSADRSFGPLKQIDAGLLDVGYAEAGPATGKPVILLHGWPYDIHSYVDVTPVLASQGYRVIVPYLRGYGTTRFLSKETFRNGQQSALANDRSDGCSEDSECYPRRV
jgi:hypothetical protein